MLRADACAGADADLAVCFFFATPLAASVAAEGMQVARATRARATVANFDKYSTSTFADTGDAVYEMVTHDLRPQLSHIRAPVLLVLADGLQQTVYREHARAVPNHEVVVLPGTRHFVFVDDPDGFVTAIKRFLGCRSFPRQAR